MPEEDVLTLQSGYNRPNARTRVSAVSYDFVDEQPSLFFIQNQPNIFIRQTVNGVYVNGKKI